MLINWLAIILAVGSFITGIYSSIKDGDGEAFGFISLGFTILIGLAWFLITLIFGLAIPKTPVYERAELHNISDRIGQEGSFFIGIGSFEEEGKFFYYENKDNVLKWKNIESENAEIHFSNQPYLMERTNCESKWSWLVQCVYLSDYVQFYIPEGTIKQNLELDNI